MFDRWAICEAYYWYDVLWGPTPYGVRLHRIGFRPGICDHMDEMGEEAKRIYGNLCLRHNRLYIGYQRYQKRNRKAPSWPGTQNMRRGAADWLKAIGVLEAVEALAPYVE